MNKKFIILFFLFFASHTFAGEKEPANPEVMPVDCYVEGKNAFNDRAKVYLKETEGVMVMYFACNKEVSDWDWYFFRNSDVNISHELAYKNCVEAAKKRKIKDCYLFAVNDTIVWGKDDTFLAKIEKEAKAKLSISVAVCVEGDCINGQGTKKFADGYTYTGEFKDGIRNGQGTERFKDGYTYTGEFKDGKRNGQGTERFANGYTYTGLFIDGKPTGEGYFEDTKQTEQKSKEIANFDIDKHLQMYEFKKYLFFDPYNNKVIFKKNDPSTLKKITFKKKRSIRTTYPKGSWKKFRWYTRHVPKNFKSFSFEAEYENNIKTKIFIEYNKDLMKEEATAENEKIIAEKKAEYFANMFGQMPHFLKKYNKKMFIHRYNGKGKDLMSAWATGAITKKEFHLTETRCGYNYYLEQFYNAEGFYHECASTMLHELAHVVHKNTKVISPSKWLSAKNSDKHFCTKYAMTNGKEDFAESMMCWIGVKYKLNRMSEKDVMVINKLLKNRIKFFDQLNLNVYPLKVPSIN